MRKSLKDLKIGLALSGGGIRAIAFHAGVLFYLAKLGLLESVKVLSTVSGGSILAGLIYSMNDGKWPKSEDYINNIFPHIKGVICNISISRYWYEHLVNPFYWKYLLVRSKVLSITLEEEWRIEGNLSDISKSPKWYIAATVAKNGEKWVFTQDYMGNDELGYAKNPDIKLSDAIAASAAYPGIVGPFQLHTSKYTWYENNPLISSFNNNIIQPDNEIYYFYDGGLYDNLGCDSLFLKFGEKLIDEIDTIIISDACAPIRGDWFCKWKVWVRTKKMVEMILSHVDQLRLGWIREYINRNKKLGILVKIDKHYKELITPGNKHLFKNFVFMPKESVEIVKGIKTHLNKISSQEFESAVRNGYETTLIKSRLYFDHYRSSEYTKND